MQEAHRRLNAGEGNVPSFCVAGAQSGRLQAPFIVGNSVDDGRGCVDQKGVSNKYRRLVLYLRIAVSARRDSPCRLWYVAEGFSG